MDVQKFRNFVITEFVKSGIHGITKNSLASLEAGTISILQRKVKNGTMGPKTITNYFKLNFIFQNIFHIMEGVGNSFATLLTLLLDDFVDNLWRKNHHETIKGFVREHLRLKNFKLFSETFSVS